MKCVAFDVRFHLFNPNGHFLNLIDQGGQLFTDLTHCARQGSLLSTAFAHGSFRSRAAALSRVS